MNFTKTTSYSLKILGFMAENEKDILSANRIHKSLGIPYSYLRQLLNTLSDKGFIVGEKGRNGGFLLKRNPEKIFLIEVVESIEGTESFERCMMGFTDCRLQNKCALHESWIKFRTELLQVLGSTSLHDLITK